MKVILICGPYGSGTSAVAGMLAKLGVIGLGPTWQTSDPRTPDSYELLAFKDMLLGLVSEETCMLKPGVSVGRALSDFKALLAASLPAEESRPIFLKHPTAALILPEFCQTFDTRLIYVLRSMREIEATRVRRKWPVGDSKGTQIIYSRMFDHLVNGSAPTMIIRYRNLIERPMENAISLAEYAALPSDPRALQQAVNVIQSRT
jgi:hypothetical protein